MFLTRACRRDHMLLQTDYKTFGVDGLYPDMQAANSIATNAPSTIRHAGFWSECW